MNPKNPPSEKAETKPAKNFILKPQGLDPYQAKAVEITTGPLLITGGPGSGKTRTLTYRVANLIQQGLAKPEECLTLTFSRRAAQEMKDRLQKLLPEKWRDIPVMTFHGLGLKILQEHRAQAGLPRGFRLTSAQERLELLKSKLEIPDAKAEKIIREITRWKRSDGSQKPPPAGLKVFQDAKDSLGWLDDDDLLLGSVKLVEEDVSLRAKYRRVFPFLSVDEYQDIDALQYRLLQLLIPAEGNLCVTGDPDQAIYSFRGASAEFFLRFDKDFPASKKIFLSRSYRSGETLVSASNQVMAAEALGEERLMESVLEDSGKILVHESPDDKAEAEYAVHCIEQLISGQSFYSIDTKRTDSALERDFSFSDFAILYRTEQQSLLIEEALERSGIPFERRSHRALSDHPRVQAYLAFIKSAPSKEALLDLLHQARLRLSSSGLTGGSTNTGMDLDKDPVYEKLEAVALRAGEKKDVFLSEIYMGEDLELWDPRADRVSLLTLHAAKGLEFPAVIIVGCEKGFLPFSAGEEISKEALAEERRLFYTGMTRAKERLVLSWAAKRFLQGKSQVREASPFLKAIEAGLLEKSKAVFEARRKNPQMELF